MDLTLSQTQRLFIKDIKEFIAREITPNLPRWYQEDIFPQELLPHLSSRQWLGFTQKEGLWQESPMTDNIIFYEYMSAVTPGVTVGILAHTLLGLYLLYHWGNQDQQDKYFIPGIKGDKLAAFANTEPETGSDASNISLEAREVGDGFLLNGTKMYITNGDLADFLVVSARTSPKTAKRSEGISLFVLDTACKGLERIKLPKKGWIPSHLARLSFKECLVPRNNLIGDLDEGYKLVMKTFTASRIAIAAMAVGTAYGAYCLALERARKRVAFGTKIIEHQAKAYEFSTMLTRIDAARLLVQRAAWLKDKGEDYIMASSQAKLFAAEEAKKITSWAADIFGASGILETNPISRYPGDAWATSLGEGTNDIQKLIIWRQILARL